jgi:tetratricopeptide (TPR) repeat protein
MPPSPLTLVFVDAAKTATLSDALAFANEMAAAGQQSFIFSLRDHAQLAGTTKLSDVFEHRGDVHLAFVTALTTTSDAVVVAAADATGARPTMLKNGKSSKAAMSLLPATGDNISFTQSLTLARRLQQSGQQRRAAQIYRQLLATIDANGAALHASLPPAELATVLAQQATARRQLGAIELKNERYAAAHKQFQLAFAVPPPPSTSSSSTTATALPPRAHARLLILLAETSFRVGDFAAGRGHATAAMKACEVMQKAAAAAAASSSSDDDDAVMLRLACDAQAWLARSLLRLSGETVEQSGRGELRDLAIALLERVMGANETHLMTLTTYVGSARVRLLYALSLSISFACMSKALLILFPFSLVSITSFYLRSSLQ